MLRKQFGVPFINKKRVLYEKKPNYIIAEIEKQRKINGRFSNCNTIYGSNVLPIIRIFDNLSPDEKMSYINALKSLLADPDIERRNFAISICIGFVVFKDAK